MILIHITQQRYKMLRLIPKNIQTFFCKSKNNSVIATMKKPTQLQKLKVVGLIHSRSNDLIRRFRTLMIDGEISLLEGKWLGIENYKNNSEFYDFRKYLEKSESWSTYSKLLLTTISFEEGDIIAKVRCCNGDMLHGEYKSDRWEATFKLKAKHLKPFDSHLNHWLTEKAAYIYEQELVDAANARIEEIKKEFFQ